MHSFVTLLLVKGAKAWFWALTFEHTNFCDTDQILTSLAEVHHPDSKAEAKRKLGDSNQPLLLPTEMKSHESHSGNCPRITTKFCNEVESSIRHLYLHSDCNYVFGMLLLGEKMCKVKLIT